jgi:hypothetical protein
MRWTLPPVPRRHPIASVVNKSCCVPLKGKIRRDLRVPGPFSLPIHFSSLESFKVEKGIGNEVMASGAPDGHDEVPLSIAMRKATR